MDMQGVMRYDDDGIDMQASGSGQGADELEMIMLDKVLYMTGVGMDLGDKKWLKIDMSDPDSLFGMLGKSTDPELMFKAMEEPKEFELLGTEEVDGVETNHYRVVMDTAAYAEAMEMPAEMHVLDARGHRAWRCGSTPTTCRASSARSSSSRPWPAVRPPPAPPRAPTPTTAPT